MGCQGCLLRVVVVLAVIWIVACLVVNLVHYGTLFPGLGM